MQNGGKIIETSEALQDLYYQYSYLPLGGKEIVCPYWMNKLSKGIFGLGGGKGKPEEIVETTKIEAEKQKIDLKSLTESEIVNFMKKNRIGVDCSGFAFWMLDALDKEKGGNGITDDIPFCRGKIIKARANVKMLTDDSVSYSVEKTGEIKPGDMIRFRNGNHMAIVLSLICKKDNQIEEILYTHSTSEVYSQVSGVHSAKILVVNPYLGLKQQKWLEKTSGGSTYAQHLWPDKGDGVKRLKIWK